MKTFIFFPDTAKSNGLGHFHRCLKFKNVLGRRYNIIFVINKFFDNKYLKEKKLKFIKYDNLRNLKLIIKKFKNPYLLLDSYSFKIHKFFSQINYFKKKILILDFKMKNDGDIIIDHTFMREKKFHKLNKNQKIFLGHTFLPINSKLRKKKTNTILIDLGSIKNNLLISKCVKKINKFSNLRNYKIIIINKYFKKKNLNNNQSNKNIKIYKYNKNIEKIYQNTFFSIGACGISLYEKCYSQIPTFSKSFAKNQIYNYKNFQSKKCISSINKFLTLKTYADLKNELKYIKINIKKHFYLYGNKRKIINIFEKM